MYKSRKILLLIIISSLYCSRISAQLDSSWNKGTNKDKLENIFNLLSEADLNAEEIINLALKAREISEAINDKKSLCKSYKYLGNGYFLKADYQNSIKIFNITLKLANELNDSSLISDCYYNLSFSYQNMGNYAEALKCGKIAFSIDYAQNDSTAMAESYNLLGIVFENLGDYEKALTNYLKSLEILEQKNDSGGIARRFNNIGIIFYNLADYQKAKSYLKRSIGLFDKLKNIKEKCKPLISMGDLYEGINQYDSALFLFMQVLDLSNQFDDKYLKSTVLSRIGDIYFSWGNHNKALEYYQQNYTIKQAIKDYDGMAGASINLAKTCLLNNDLEQALKYLTQANEYWKIVKSNKLLVDIYMLYYTIYKKQKNEGLALQYLEMYTSAKDSVLSTDTRTKIYELNTIYETEKKDKENEILRQSNKIQELELARSNIARNLSLAIACLILTIAIFLLGRYRNKLKTNAILENHNKLLEEQKSVIERKNLQITDSILYASLIQQSMFPNTEILSEAFPDSFIFFKPRDIVSGDFYWMLEIDNKMVVAVADCTGHGVPAAFMSMLGIEILSEIFESKKINHTDIALHHLKESINKSLHQDKTGNEDGMEISVCIIDKQNKTLEFSGARRPIIYIENGKMNQIVGDKIFIGGSTSINRSFTKHRVKFDSSISIYLFSDGYQDQFGGPHNGKISYNLLKELIHLHSTKPMNEQKKFLTEFFSNWKGDSMQIDDILIMGIRIE